MLVIFIVSPKLPDWFVNPAPTKAGPTELFTEHKASIDVIGVIFAYAGIILLLYVVINGVLLCATDKYIPSGENVAPLPILASPDRLVSLVNVSPLRLYIVIYGDVACATDRYTPSGENAAPRPVPVGKADGLASLVNISPLRLYIVIKGDVKCATDR
jgi:hypothetical protein